MALSAEWEGPHLLKSLEAACRQRVQSIERLEADNRRQAKDNAATAQKLLESRLLIEKREKLNQSRDEFHERGVERLAQEKIEHEKSLAEKHAALAVKEKALKQREEDLEARLDGLRTQEHAVSGRLKDLDHATKLLEERIAAYIALRADQRRENEMSKDDVPGQGTHEETSKGLQAQAAEPWQSKKVDGHNTSKSQIQDSPIGTCKSGSNDWAQPVNSRHQTVNEANQGHEDMARESMQSARTSAQHQADSSRHRKQEAQTSNFTQAFAKRAGEAIATGSSPCLGPWQDNTSAREASLTQVTAELQDRRSRPDDTAETPISQGNGIEAGNPKQSPECDSPALPSDVLINGSDKANDGKRPGLVTEERVPKRTKLLSGDGSHELDAQPTCSASQPPPRHSEEMPGQQGQPSTLQKQSATAEAPHQIPQGVLGNTWPEDTNVNGCYTAEGSNPAAASKQALPDTGSQDRSGQAEVQHFPAIFQDAASQTAFHTEESRHLDNPVCSSDLNNLHWSQGSMDSNSQQGDLPPQHQALYPRTRRKCPGQKDWNNPDLAWQFHSDRAANGFHNPRPMPGRPGPRGRLPGRGFGRGGWATRSPMCMPQYCSPSTVPAPRPPAVPPPQPPAIPPPQAPSVPPPKSTAMQPPAAPVVDPAAAFSGTRGKKGGLQSRGRGRGRAWQKSEDEDTGSLGAAVEALKAAFASEPEEDAKGAALAGPRTVRTLRPRMKQI